MLTATILVFNSCKKENSSTTAKTTEQEITTKKKPTTNFIDPACEGLANPCSDPRCAPYYNCNLDPYAMTTLFSGIDHAQLQQLLNSNNLAALENFLSPIANQIANRIFTKYGEDIHDEIGNEPQAMVLLGLFEYGVENNYSLDGYNSAARTPYDNWMCFINALSDNFGISAIRSVYNDFRAGVSPRTVVRALRQLGTRIWLGFTIGIAIYSLGDCLDWW